MALSIPLSVLLASFILPFFLDESASLLSCLYIMGLVVKVRELTGMIKIGSLLNRWLSCYTTEILYVLHTPLLRWSKARFFFLRNDCGRECSRLTSNPMAPFRWPRLIPSGISSKERALSPSKTAEPAFDQSPQGLKVVAEGVNPVVEYPGLPSYISKTDIS